MNCEKIQVKISELSADNLSAHDASVVLAHLETCSSCQECWEEYQQMMFALSTSTQPIPGALQSQQMWSHCHQRITESEIDTRYASSARAAIRNSSGDLSSNALWGWIGIQPRWGWVAVGGILAIVGATWFATAPTTNSAIQAPITSARVFAPSNFNTVDFPPAPTPDRPGLNLPSYDSTSPNIFQAPTIPASMLVDRPTIADGNPLNSSATSSDSSYTVPANAISTDSVVTNSGQ